LTEAIVIAEKSNDRVFCLCVK